MHSCGVATVLTACGIETSVHFNIQCIKIFFRCVATVLIACGIETLHSGGIPFQDQGVATVLTACGIETSQSQTFTSLPLVSFVATVLTACGIETHEQYRQLGIFSC